MALPVRFVCCLVYNIRKTHLMAATSSKKIWRVTKLFDGVLKLEDKKKYNFSHKNEENLKIEDKPKKKFIPK